MRYRDPAISLDMVNRHHQAEPQSLRASTTGKNFYELIAAAGFHAVEIPFEPVWNFGGRRVPFTQYAIRPSTRTSTTTLLYCAVVASSAWPVSASIPVSSCAMTVWTSTSALPDTSPGWRSNTP